MLKKIKNKKIVIISLCIMVLLLVIGTSIALWTRAFTQTGVNTNTTNCFDITFSEGNSVSQTNLYPQTDEQGLTNTPYQVTITNTCNIAASYSVVLHKDNTSTLDNSHIKVAVDNNTKLLSSLTSKTSSINSSTYTAYEIGLGVVPGNTSKTISIRSWMEANTSQSDGENKSFNYKITIEATPNSNLLAAKVLNSHYPITKYEDVSQFGAMPTYHFKTIKENENFTFDDGVLVGDSYFSDNLSASQYGWGISINASDYFLDLCPNYDWDIDGDLSCLINYYMNYNKGYAIKIKELKFDEDGWEPYVLKADIIKIEQDPIEAEGLIEAQDDEGTSYVYRGDIKNNNVQFGSYQNDVYAAYDNTNNIVNVFNLQSECQSYINSYSTYTCKKIHNVGDPIIWKIIRINGDGSIRLVLDESIGKSAYNGTTNDQQEKYAGYTYDNNHICTNNNPCASNAGTNSIIKSYLDNWYTTNLTNVDNKIATSSFCNDTSISSQDNTKFAGYQRKVNKVPILTCPDTSKTYGGKYKLKIGTLTADELVVAGFVSNKIVEPGKLQNYLSNYYWSYIITPMSTSGYVDRARNGSIDTGGASPHANEHIHPVINLKSDVAVARGDGTASNPYVIE